MNPRYSYIAKLRCALRSRGRFLLVRAGSGAAPRAQPRTVRSACASRGCNSYLGIGVAEIDAERAKALNLKKCAAWK